MNRLLVLIVGLSVLAGACSDSSPSTPGQETTTTSTYTVPLSSANEVPPITNADAGSSGTATITLTVTKDGAGSITAATMNFQISVTDSAMVSPIASWKPSLALSLKRIGCPMYARW